MYGSSSSYSVSSIVHQRTLKSDHTQGITFKWQGTGGREPRRTGAGRVRETGEERAGSEREIQKGKLS